MLRPRVFLLMLTAFGLVIVLGIGGMVTFFAIAVSGARDHQWRNNDAGSPWATSRELANYYQRQGSWQGVSELPVFQVASAAPNNATTLLDNTGQVVASNQLDMPGAGADLPPLSPVFGGRMPRDTSAARAFQSMPIRVRGDQVGTLVFATDPSMFDGGPNGFNFVRGMLSAGLALAAILLGLAAFFSGRISRPLRRLTNAAQAMSTGDMSVRVSGSPVREVHELSQAFNRMADSLVQSDQQRRQLTADIAHELRTPLSVVKGRLEGIQDGVYTPSNEQIDGLLDEVALLERLIEDLRLLALADAGQLPLYLEPVDPVQLLADAQRSFAHQAQQRDITLTIRVADALPEFTADPQRLAQVLSNLVGNALRYTPAGGTITVCAMSEPTAHTLTITVADTGKGIAPDDLPHIFDRFWRADRSRTRGSGGAGLGLAIARRIVEAHGGTMWAESTPGQGTMISFCLPV